MKVRTKLAFLLLLTPSLCMSMPAYGNIIIYDNGGPIPVNAQCSDPSPDNTAWYADDFTLQPGLNTITDVHWWGVYLYDNTPPTDIFTLEIYADLTSPRPLHTLNVVNFQRTDTGDTAFNSNIYEYSAEIDPIILTHGTQYLLSIFDDTTADSGDNWYWMWSTPADSENKCWKDNYPDSH